MRQVLSLCVLMLAGSCALGVEYRADGQVFDAQWTADGKYLVILSETPDGQVIDVWDATRNESVSRHTVDRVDTVSVFTCGPIVGYTRLIPGSNQSTVTRWSLLPGSTQTTMTVEGWVLDVDCQHESTILVEISLDRRDGPKLSLLELDSGSQVPLINHATNYDYRINAKGDVLSVTTDSKSLELIPSGGGPRRILASLPVAGEEFMYARWSRDGRFVYASTRIGLEGRVRTIWRMPMGGDWEKVFTGDNVTWFNVNPAGDTIAYGRQPIAISWGRLAVGDSRNVYLAHIEPPTPSKPAATGGQTNGAHE